MFHAETWRRHSFWGFKRCFTMLKDWWLKHTASSRSYLLLFHRLPTITELVQQTHGFLQVISFTVTWTNPLKPFRQLRSFIGLRTLFGEWLNYGEVRQEMHNALWQEVLSKWIDCTWMNENKWRFPKMGVAFIDSIFRQKPSSFWGTPLEPSKWVI